MQRRGDKRVKGRWRMEKRGRVGRVGKRGRMGRVEKRGRVGREGKQGREEEGRDSGG